MTTIFEPERTNGYEYVTTVHGYHDDRIIDSLDGTSRKDSWKPIPVHRGPVNRRQKGRPADFPGMFDSLILRRSAIDALQDLLDAHGELLPLETEDGIELYLFNTRFMIDALDRERSTIEPYVVTKGEKILKHVFVEEKIRGIDIFRIPIGPNMNYVSDRFVQRVKKAKLKGLDFIKLWSSE